MSDDSAKGFYEGREAGDFLDEEEPFALFQDWFSKAHEYEPNDPEAVSLATVDQDGMPNLRMVLVKDASPAGFVFYTNLESAKGRELLQNPKACMNFHWKSLRRQIRIRGPVELVGDDEADAYFNSRPMGSRIGAWASRQSRPMDEPLALTKAVARYTAKYAVSVVPRPKHWSGFRLSPLEIEFWHDRRFRLHDRIVFTRAAPGEPWTKTRLYP